MSQVSVPHQGTMIERLHGRYHRVALNLFMLIVLAHWAEHLVQAFQIWVLGWPAPRSRGVLGQFSRGWSPPSGCTTATRW